MHACVSGPSRWGVTRLYKLPIQQFAADDPSKATRIEKKSGRQGAVKAIRWRAGQDTVGRRQPAGVVPAEQRRGLPERGGKWDGRSAFFIPCARSMEARKSVNTP